MRTSSSCAPAVLLALLAQAAWGASVSGSFFLTDSHDPSVKKRNYSGVAVWLEPLSGKPPAIPERAFTIRQKDKRFSPHVLVVPVGSTVNFPNLDPIFHNAFSNFAGQPFDTGLYPPGTSQKVRFVRGGIVRIFCNIHSSMSAVIVVLETPWYASTAQDGAFRIENVPPGDYRLHVWHERATEQTLAGLERKISLGAENLGLPRQNISELGYVILPHTNKHGNPYPPEPAAGTQYMGLGR